MMVCRFYYGLIILISVNLSGCFDAKKLLFGESGKTTISITVDKPTGRYNVIPTSVDLTFTTTVDMTSISASDFSITETCAIGTPAVSGISTTAQVVTVSLSSVAGCANTETVTLTLNNSLVKMTDTSKYLTGTTSYVYTRDTAAPTVSAAINSISGISTSGSYAFSSVPTSVVYSFSSDTDLNSVVAADFNVVSAGGTDCTVLPTIGTLSRNTSTGTVTVPLTGATCNDGESFRLSLTANSVDDVTLDGTTGASNPLTAPAADLDLNISVFTSSASVTDVGSGATTPSGTYGIGATIDIVVTFDQAVDVTGTPRLQLNITGGSTRYATYSSGTGTTDLTFSYTTVASDTAADLNYSSTSALQLNGGTISRAGSSGGIAATRTLATPGAANSLGFNRNIVIDTNVPTITTSSPAGPTNTWGLESRVVTFTMSKEIDPASLADSDLTITAGTCGGTLPTVLSSSLTGATNNIVNFTLSNYTCADGETYVLELDPSTVTDLSSNTGSGSNRTITVTTETSKPTLSLSAPSVTAINSSSTVTYTATYSGANSVTLSNTDINFAGASASCAASVTGSGTTTRTISITSCSGDGSVQIDVSANTAVNVYGNYADAVAEGSITDFNADNTPLPDPTLALPTFGVNSVYDEDNNANFTLTFAGDDLGSAGAIQSALALNCDSGGGSNPVSLTAARTSATVATVTPNEAASDFTYNANCLISGANVPDSAGNLHTFAGLPFKVGRTLNATSGPSGTISISTATTNGDLGNVVFNVATNSATIISANVTLVCNGNDITLSALNLSAGDTTVTIDFDETDADWIALVGGESCALTFSSSVENSLGMPLPSPEVFNFTTSP